ncbi:MAG: KpsF/GutQ family sugar-phosphate isomerase [Candidatus Aminicenantes bacterium]|nr:KpsF/GutQ family sugar-phosphate isomerase [Candidatus Aminicenantes bacterium]
MKKNAIIKTGREVLEIESRTLAALVPRLDDNFARAVGLLARSKSRVIVTGMGKSGLVGRKIAATLASCGTPALFIHPAEAGHGDLGMILKDDVILAISYSGETREIVDLLEFIKRIGVKLIIITGDRKSRIAKYSDIVLDARVEREAGPKDMVPTSSSTAALAMGDALAIALMKEKGFDEKDFVRFHPKGQLGRKLLRVETLMHVGAEIPRVTEATPMIQVIEEITRKKLGVTCIVDSNDRLLGVITDGDLRRMLRKHKERLFKKSAGECMTAHPVTIDGEGLATEALNLMEERKITSLVVADKAGKVEGIIHLHDLWRTEMF